MHNSSVPVQLCGQKQPVWTAKMFFNFVFLLFGYEYLPIYLHNASFLLFQMNSSTKHIETEEEAPQDVVVCLLVGRA